MKKTSPNIRTARGLFALALVVAVSALIAGGCGKDQKPLSRDNVESLLKKGIKPNEMGMVMVLEYHRVLDKESNYTRSIENFRKDLQTLYQKGYRLVTFHDLMAGKINVPAGTTPVVLSFDDSTESQIRYLKQGDKTVLDPNCALGIIQAFHKEHPDFGYTALFNYLPTLFEQPSYQKAKVDYLYENGFELGDHTITHPLLARATDEQVQKEVAVPIKNMRAVNPNVKVDILCLPNGSIPKNQALMYNGSYEGTTYHNKWALLVGSNPFYPVYHYKNPGKLVPRIQAMDYDAQDGSGADGSGYWLRYFDNHPEQRFISDGDSATICAPAYMETRLLANNLPHGVTYVGY